MIEKCDNCNSFAYVCGDYFCNHPKCPETTPTSPWPWLHYPYKAPDWCPLDVENAESILREEDEQKTVIDEDRTVN